LTIRPWESQDGDPANPERVFGAPVQEILARRADQTGALLALDANRFALTGPVTAMGRSMALLHYIRVQARDARAADREWLDEVYRLLGQRQPGSYMRTGSVARSAPRAH